MIVTLTRYTTRLAIRLRNTLDGGQIINWRNLQLVVMPPAPENCGCCHVPNSPWVLTGCWPYHPTGVDVANPHRIDFPAMVFNAFETDKAGRIVFALDHRIDALPNGRYDGLIRVGLHEVPINMPLPLSARHAKSLGAQVHYTPDGRLVPCEPVPPPPLPVHACVLARFGIELGPECAQHMVDQCVVEFARGDCGEDE